MGLAQELANKLGNAWNVQPDSDGRIDEKWFRLMHDSGLKLSCRVDSWRKKGFYEFNVYPPTDETGRQTRFRDWLRNKQLVTEINISKTKEIERVATELNRRMLVDAINAMTEVNRIRQETAERFERAHKEIQDACAMVGVEYTPSKRDWPSEARGYGKNELYYKLRRMSDGKIELGIDSVTLEQLEKIIKAI